MTQTAQAASLAKDLLTFAVCAAGGVLLLGAIVALLIRLGRYFRAMPVAFGLTQFVVAPELDTKVGAIINNSLHMELRRAAAQLARPFAA
jgi:hypothetical protein